MQKAGEMYPLTACLQPCKECEQSRTSWVPAALLGEHRGTENRRNWPPHIILTQTTDFLRFFFLNKICAII